MFAITHSNFVLQETKNVCRAQLAKGNVGENPFANTHKKTILTKNVCRAELAKANVIRNPFANTH
jgi:hypothetical protein